MRKILCALFLFWVLFSFSCTDAPEPMKEAPAPIPQEIVDQVAETHFEDVRIKPFQVAVQCWTYRKFTFLETLEKVKALGLASIEAYPGQSLGADFADAAFHHEMSDDLVKSIREKLRESGLRVVAYGVVNIGTTEDSMREVFDFAKKMGIRTIVCEPEEEDFTVLEKLVKEYNIRIAIHNHPQPTKYALPQTLLDHIQGRDERIGVCADTGHWMREGLNPVECLRMLEGRIIDLHLKDRSDFGKDKTAVDVGWGEGKANVHDILAEMTLQDFGGHITIEYENDDEVLTPEPAIQRGLEYIKGITYFEGYTPLLRRSGREYEKHGWNHYGPGHFELDPRTGILTSQGGMGLLWYSAKTYGDFVLELDYKCSQPDTNSGVFLRVPAVPTSDSYIYHSFEIQIQDSSQGIHKTGAAYDAEAPAADAARPTGEWNHFKITFLGKRLQVELNGTNVLDWDAEPRGKIQDFAMEGYIGLQNHDSISPVFFRNIYIKELQTLGVVL